ncbi:MAG: hypothetical protein SPL05_05575 [Eubacteriales bacterium]|nr:hypothetical protein [Eubacteriales bacterium]
MKKITLAMLGLLQITCLTSAYILHYFTYRTMGMSRYVVVMSKTMAQLLPMQWLIYFGMGLFGLCTTYLLIKYNRHNFASKYRLYFNIESIVLLLASSIYTFVFNINKFRDYYYISIFCNIILLLQIGKLYLLLFNTKSKNQPPA